MNSDTKYINLLIILLAFCVLKVYSIDCYECEGEACNNIQDTSSMVKTCGADPSPTTTTTSTTTTNPATGSTIDASTDSPETSTEEPVTDTTEFTEETPGTTPEITTQVDEVRFARSLSSDYYIKPAELLVQKYSNLRAEPLYACYSTYITDTIRKHGCIEFLQDVGACPAVHEKYSVQLPLEDMKCWHCDYDKCNGGTSVGYSIILLLSSALIYKLFN